MSKVEHFEFPKTSSKEKLLESLDTFLASPEAGGVLKNMLHNPKKLFKICQFDN